jgi:hypothetical protein
MHQGKLTFDDCPLLPKQADGWYFGTPPGMFPGDQAGPYATQKERDEARGSFVRNWIGNFRQNQICVGST